MKPVSMCAFSVGQKYLHEQCRLLVHLVDFAVDAECRHLRQWSLIVLARLWLNYDDARWAAIRMNAHEQICTVASTSASAAVRCAAVHALATLISNRASHDEHATAVAQNISLYLINECIADCSSDVRAELIVALHWLVLDFEDNIVTLAYDQQQQSARDAATLIGGGNVYMQVWSALLRMSADPCTAVAELARRVVDYIMDRMALIDSTVC